MHCAMERMMQPRNCKDLDSGQKLLKVDIFWPSCEFNAICFVSDCIMPSDLLGDHFCM